MYLFFRHYFVILHYLCMQTNMCDGKSTLCYHQKMDGNKSRAAYFRWTHHWRGIGNHCSSVDGHQYFGNGLRQRSESHCTCTGGGTCRIIGSQSWGRTRTKVPYRCFFIPTQHLYCCFVGSYWMFSVPRYHPIMGIDVGFVTALILGIISTLGACGASGVAGGSLLLIPMACSFLGIDNDVAMQAVAIGFIIGVVQDSVETALNSSSDVFFTATAEFYDRNRIQRPLK